MVKTFLITVLCLSSLLIIGLNMRISDLEKQLDKCQKKDSIQAPKKITPPMPKLNFVPKKKLIPSF